MDDHRNTTVTAEKLPPYLPGPNSVDITPTKDGGVMKEILRRGTGGSYPLTGDTVFIHFVGTLLDGTKFESSRDQGVPVEFSQGSGKNNAILCAVKNFWTLLLTC